MYCPTLIRTEKRPFSVRIDEKLELVLNKAVFPYGLVSVSPREFARARGAIAGIPLSPGLATLRVPFPCPLAAGALANDLKLTALRPLGFSRTSPYTSKLLTALHEKSPALCAELQIVCGERGSEESPA